MSNFKRRFDRDGLSEESKRVIEDTSFEAKVDAQGIAGDNLFEPIPQYISSPCENVVSNKNNSWIVLGRDRNSSRLSGYGGKGHTQCGSIDLVVGRQGYEVRSVNEDNEQLWVDPDFEKDAARIYISQKSDVDEYFKIDGENVKTKSSIGIKADQVRIIGREKVRIITGTDEVNSQGARINEIGGIELQAGNDSQGLQPIPKGDNLVNAIRQLTDLVDNLSGIVDTFLMSQFDFDQVVGTHFHIESFFAQPCLPSETLIPAQQKHALEMLTRVKKSILSFKTNLGMYKMTYLEEMGSDYVCSRKNKVN